MIAAAVLALSAGTAHASCNPCGPGGPPTPPTVQPPTQPPQPPRCNTPACGHGGVRVVVPPVVIPPPSVSINYGAAHVGLNVHQNVTVAGGGGMFFGRGGGMVGEVDAGVSGGMLNVSESRAETVTRMVETERAIQAICIDDRNDPHAASQTFGEANVATAYRGEIYRCMAGTKMRVSVGKWADGKADFNGARTLECAKGEALVYDGREVVCRTQEAKRPCNERSLLRRFGAGLKVVMLRETETVAVERRQMFTEQSMQMSFDGGVGQSVW
jgi:hypothetical protein